ncbi:hypothetical protein MTO96_029951 [Rhipicephalus appendiculatus]
MGAGSLGVVGAPAVATTDEDPHQGRRCCADILEGSGEAAAAEADSRGHPSRGGGHHATVEASPTTTGGARRSHSRARVDRDTFCSEDRWRRNTVVLSRRK